MSWAKVDDGFFHNGKVLATSLAARGLWITALSWSGANTEARGVLPPHLPSFLAMGDATDLAHELVDAGLWHKAGHDCDRCPQVDTGYVIHDWPEYQEKALSEKRAEAGRKGGRSGTGDSKRRAPAKQDAKQERKQTASNSQASAQAGIPTRPVPDPRSTPSSPAAADDTPAADDLTGFDAFWEAWPKRGGKRLYRGKAEDQWRKLTLEQRRAAYRGARHYAAASDAGTQGAMDAFRWLRDGAWTDWQEPADPTQRGSPRDRPITRLEDGSEIAL